VKSELSDGLSLAAPLPDKPADAGALAAEGAAKKEEVKRSAEEMALWLHQGKRSSLVISRTIVKRPPGPTDKEGGKAKDKDKSKPAARPPRPMSILPGKRGTVLVQETPAVKRVRPARPPSDDASKLRRKLFDA